MTDERIDLQRCKSCDEILLPGDVTPSEVESSLDRGCFHIRFEKDRGMNSHWCNAFFGKIYGNKFRVHTMDSFIREMVQRAIKVHM